MQLFNFYLFFRYAKGEGFEKEREWYKSSVQRTIKIKS